MPEAIAKGSSEPLESSPHRADDLSPVLNLGEREYRMSSLRRIALSALLVFATLSSATGTATGGEPKVKLTRAGKAVRVEIGGELFTEYLGDGHRKPILFPVIGPHRLAMTRSYPIVSGVKGEAKDHPHHRSLWFTHGDVNGISFWHENEGSGETVHDTFLEIRSGDQGVLKTFNKWVGPDGKVVCTDVRRLTFLALPVGRAVRYEVTLYASEGDVTLGDTKEGTMGIRTHPNLRLTNDEKRGVTSANGHALNSSGERDGALWGKRAKWVDYWGEIDGETVGVAIFDHPKNPRHPTWWHARNYGLIAANAFGVHNFERKEKGTGDLTIKAGDSLHFEFFFVFHAGNAESAKVEALYDAFARSSVSAD